jgi:hypothetical protein
MKRTLIALALALSMGTASACSVIGSTMQSDDTWVSITLAFTGCRNGQQVSLMVFSDETMTKFIGASTVPFTIRGNTVTIPIFTDRRYSRVWFRWTLV